MPHRHPEKTVFNSVATCNSFERRFADFLDHADAGGRFAAPGVTEEGTSGTQFRMYYLKPSGTADFCHSDWVVVQKTKGGQINWIIEANGQVWVGTEIKML